MISFALSEDQQLADSMFAGLARDVLRPAAPGLDDGGTIPAPLLDQLWSTGLAEAALGRDAGDTHSHISNCLALEAFGWADAALAVAIAAPLGVVRALAEQGSPDQKAHAHAVASGNRYHGAALLVQEPGFGFDPGEIATRAEPTPQGYKLTGAKACLPLPGLCSDLLVVARCEGDLAAFLVPPDGAGVAIDPPAGSLGLKALALSDIRFDGVALPATAKLGGDDGCDVRAILDGGRTAAAAILTGLSRAVLEHLVPYLKDRVAHGTPLARKQSVAFRLADMATEVPAMRWMAWQAACALAKNVPATREARLAQLHCAEQARWITDEGVQLMGGHGYMRENPVERWYRDARTLAAIEGMGGL